MIDILNHLLSLDAVRYILMREVFIPTCELTSVEGTLIDFRFAQPALAGVGCFLAAGGGLSESYEVSVLERVETRQGTSLQKNTAK